VGIFIATKEEEKLSVLNNNNNRFCYIFFRSLLEVCLPFANSVRTKVRYSLRSGKEKTVKSIPERFYRLAWGIYIHGRAGRNKRKWKKPDWKIEKGKQHVFCDKTKSRLYDKMVAPYWRKHRHYPDSPYNPYHKRTGMPSTYEPPKYVP